jgi:hypothetical protein
MLTCHSIGLDRQPHYAHDGMTTNVAFRSPKLAQL